MQRRVAMGVLVALCGAAGVARAQSAATQQLLDEADKLYDGDNFDKAAAYYDRAIAGEPNGVKATAYAKRASIFLIKGGEDKKQYEKGLAWITNTAEKAWPGDDTILEQKALILMKIPGRQGDAFAAAEKVVAHSPGRFLAQLLVGDHYFQAGAGAADKTATAYEAYLKSRTGEATKTDGFTRVKLGFTYLNLGRHADAVKQFEEAERKFKSNDDIAGNARKGMCAAYTGMADWNKAITLCEQAIRDKARLKGDPSPYFNIGQAYLNRGQYDNALAAANAYIGAKQKNPQGYLLRGDVYLRQERWNDAESQYNQAGTLAPGDGNVARRLGKVYLKQKRAKKAIEVLSKIVQQNPGDLDTRIDLGEAYLADGQGANAATQASEALKATTDPNAQAKLYALAGAGYYQSGELANARLSYEKAIGMAKNPEGRWKQQLINTINRQGAEKFNAGDLAGAEALLAQARELDAESTITNFNLGLVAIEKKAYADAIRYLTVRLKKQPNDLITNRLLGRAYLGAKNGEKAAEYYAAAEAEAKKLHNLPVLAEIYTEWAPLLLAAGKTDEAVDKLEQAAQYAVNQPYSQQTQRNYQLALFKRGYERLRAKKGSDAVADLEGATRYPTLLVGNEEAVFTFALGLAYLDAGQNSKATAIFEDLAQKMRTTNPSGWLKPPFDKVGADLFVAYALYREGSASSRGRAAGVFDKLVGKTTGALASKIKDLLRSTQEFIAYDAYVRGSLKEAEAALKKADSMGGANKNEIDHNLAALTMDKNPTGAKSVFDRVKDKVPEALANLGILADRAGDAKAAYDLWVEARAKGARNSKLDEWINAKKRVFGFGGGGQ